MVKDFFVRWSVGIKDYFNSTTGLLELKLIFLGFVIIGLFAGGVQMFFNESFWLGWILSFFGLVSSVDFRMLFISYRGIKKIERAI